MPTYIEHTYMRCRLPNSFQECLKSVRKLEKKIVVGCEPALRENTEKMVSQKKINKSCRASLEISSSI